MLYPVRFIPLGALLPLCLSCSGSSVDSPAALADAAHVLADATHATADAFVDETSPPGDASTGGDAQPPSDATTTDALGDAWVDPPDAGDASAGPDSTLVDAWTVTDASTQDASFDTETGSTTDPDASAPCHSYGVPLGSVCHPSTKGICQDGLYCSVTCKKLPGLGDACDAPLPISRTQIVTLELNLDASTKVTWKPFDPSTPGATSAHRTTVWIVDSIGRAQPVELFFRKTSDNAWEYYAYGKSPGGTPVWFGVNPISFDTQGRSDGASFPLALSFSGAMDQAVLFDFSNATQVDLPSQTFRIARDGHSSMTCAPGLTCKNGACALGASAGQACDPYRPWECASTRCETGVCGSDLPPLACHPPAQLGERCGHVTTPVLTNLLTIAADLTADDPVPTAPWDAQDPYSTSNSWTDIDVYDSLGARHTLAVFFRKTADMAWEYHVLARSMEITGGIGTYTEVGSGTLTFDTAGGLDTFAVTVPVYVNFVGAAPGQMVSAKFDGTRCVADPWKIRCQSANGAPPSSCAPGLRCDPNTTACVPRNPTGVTCSHSSECLSSLCPQGVCVDPYVDSCWP